MGGFSYVSSVRTSQSQKAQVAEQKAQIAELVQAMAVLKLEEIDLDQLLDSLTDTQIGNVNTAIWYEQLREAEGIYRQESVKMQVDSMNIPRASLTFQVVAGDVETAERIIRVYEDMAAGLNQWIAEEVQGESATALSELISLTRSSASGQEAVDTFRITVYHVSEKECTQLAEKVNEYFQERQPQLADRMGEHQIRLVNQEFSFVMDMTLLENQQKVQNSIISWNNSAAAVKANFSEKEWQYYNYLTTGTLLKISLEEQESEETETVSEGGAITTITVIQPAVSKKYILMGMVLFAFMYVFYVFIKYILNVRVRVTDNVADIYGVPELGVIPAAGDSKKIFAFVDNWILKLRDWNKRRFTMEEATGLAAVAVKMAARKDGLEEVCCVGCNLKANAVDVADAIQKVLKDVDISMKVLNNVLYDQEAMEQMLSAKGAFLLERAGETFYDEIDREIELLRRQEIKVLGVIVVE